MPEPDASFDSAPRPRDAALADALLARDSGAPAAVYDAYAARLYAYCWFLLRNRDVAQQALRDTFIVAEAHIDKLREPDRFGAWLYAIARCESVRRRPDAGVRPDVPIASHDQDDVDQRIMAWHAVDGMPPRSQEILELRLRHRLSLPDVAAVLGTTSKAAQQVLTEAHMDLDGALTAELLAYEGPYGCPTRADILRERSNVLTSHIKQELLRHARTCPVCAACRPRTVSPGRVYGLLPTVRPPESLRLSVMSCFMDPELVSYRLFVATRAGDFDATGFPAHGRVRQPMRRRRTLMATRGRTGSRTALMIGGVAVALVMAIAMVGWIAGFSGRTARHAASGVRPSVGVPSPTPPSGGPIAGVGDADVKQGLPAAAVFPAAVRRPFLPPVALPSSPPAEDHPRRPSAPPPPDDTYPPPTWPRPEPAPTARTGDPCPEQPVKQPPPSPPPSKEPSPDPEPTAEPSPTPTPEPPPQPDPAPSDPPPGG